MRFDIDNSIVAYYFGPPCLYFRLWRCRRRARGGCRCEISMQTWIWKDKGQSRRRTSVSRL